MSDATARLPTPATVDEFLAWPGDGRAKRYELVDGQVRAMSPGSIVHGVIQLTFGSMIRDHLRRSGSLCTALTEPLVRPKVRGETNARVPDIGVTCSPIADGQMILDQPVLLIEVLSPSNKAKTWTNVWTYTTLPSVREIVVVHSRRVEVQLLRCSKDRIWPDDAERLQAGDVLNLESIGLRCSVEDIYSDTPLV